MSVYTGAVSVTAPDPAGEATARRTATRHDRMTDLAGRRRRRRGRRAARGPPWPSSSSLARASSSSSPSGRCTSSIATDTFLTHDNVLLLTAPGGDLLDRRHRHDDGDAPRRARHLLRRHVGARRVRRRRRGWSAGTNPVRRHRHRRSASACVVGLVNGAARQRTCGSRRSSPRSACSASSRGWRRCTPAGRASSATSSTGCRFLARDEVLGIPIPVLIAFGLYAVVCGGHDAHPVRRPPLRHRRQPRGGATAPASGRAADPAHRVRRRRRAGRVRRADAGDPRRPGPGDDRRRRPVPGAHRGDPRRHQPARRAGADRQHADRLGVPGRRSRTG